MFPCPIQMLTDVAAIALRKPRIGNHKAFFHINDKDVGVACVKFILTDSSATAAWDSASEPSGALPSPI